jgi:hypothetical protein
MKSPTTAPKEKCTCTCVCHDSRWSAFMMPVRSAHSYECLSECLADLPKYLSETDA